jgi:replication-associated recombination protein RarA
MTARLLTGSKQEIAAKVANLDGDVREAIVFVEEAQNETQQSAPEGLEDIFEEMLPFTSKVHDFDDSRESMYEQTEGE